MATDKITKCPVCGGNWVADLFLQKHRCDCCGGEISDIMAEALSVSRTLRLPDGRSRKPG